MIGDRQKSWDWQRDAACANIDTALFFQADNERGASVRLREKKAKAICARCPVVQNCLKDALNHNEPYGVWGGMSADERYRLVNNLGGVGTRSANNQAEAGQEPIQEQPA